MSLNKNNIRLFFIIFLITAFQTPSSGQEELPTQSLDEVVITATRTIRQLSSLPQPVILISQEQLKETGVQRLNEILNEQTGIITTPDVTIGGGEGVQIQGIASDYILVLIDGLPIVGRSSGNLDLSRVAIGNIEQIEIVKGPSSSLFGSEALGGVINIITAKPDSEKITGQVSHRAASFNNQNTNLSFGQKKGKFGYSLFADRLSTDGYDLAPSQEGQTVNPFVNYTFSGRFFFDFSEKFDLFASGRYFFQEFDVAPSTSEEKDANALIRANHKPSEKIRLEYEFYYTNYVTDELAVDPIDDQVLLQNDFDQKLFRPEIRVNFLTSSENTWSFGTGANFEYLDRSLFAEDVNFNSQYIFAQYDFIPLEKLNLIVGARFDNHSEYNSQLSPKISVKYDITEQWFVKGSVGSGFKAPDFRQLYLDFTNVAGGGYSVFGKEVEVAGIQRLEQNGEIATLAVDPNELGDPLDAESSIGYNLGFGYRKGVFSSSINFFRNDFENLIDTRILAAKTNGQNVFGYINRDRVYTQGLELDTKYKPLDNLMFSLGYQLLYAYDKDKEEAVDNGEVFARDPETLETIQLTSSDYFGLENRSRHLVNFKIFYKVPKWDASANLRINYRSKFGLTDTNGNDLLDVYDTSFVEDYALVNLALNKTFKNRLQWQLGANNLLDFQGSNPLAPAGSEVAINPGIEFFTKLNFQF